MTIKIEIEGALAMKWFGPSWGAAVCEDCEHVDTPAGLPCVCCRELVVGGEQGLMISSGSDGLFRPLHRECFIYEMCGPAEHIRKVCRCFGGKEDGPEGLSIRQQAVRSQLAITEMLNGPLN